jgi:hypothetical protein
MADPAPRPRRPETRNPERLEIEELTRLQPGLARLMPEIGARFWKAAYAAKAGNWPLARWQLKEMSKLFRIGDVTRPKYRDDVEEFLHHDIAPLLQAVEAADLAAFEQAFAEAVDATNDYHRRWDKEFIVWKLPDSPPPDLDLSPR